MKTIRTHNYQIDGYGCVNFIRVDMGSDILPTRFFGGEKEQKTEPGLPGCKSVKRLRQSSLSFFAKRLVPWKTSTMSTTTTTRGWSRRKVSTHEIRRLPRVEQPTQPSRPRGRR
jgi:hypothetical protein